MFLSKSQKQMIVFVLIGLITAVIMTEYFGKSSLFSIVIGILITWSLTGLAITLRKQLELIKKPFPDKDDD